MKVVLKVARGARSKFVAVTVAGTTTPCLAVKDRPLEIGVSEGSLPLVITIEATGYLDDTCTSPVDPAEHVSTDSARFRRGRVETVELTLPSSRAEANCADGADDDDDGLVDCVDPDCEQRHCSSREVCLENEVCSEGTCQHGTTIACTSAPQCYAPLGTCKSGIGCVWTPSPNADCNDLDPCTSNDRCTAGAACVGSPITCTTPPNGCWRSSGTCQVDAGCVYQRGAAGDACVGGGLCDTDGGCVN